MDTSRLTLDIPKDLKNTLKILSATHNISVKQYIVDAVSAKIQHDDVLEDMVLGVMAKKASKDGYASKSKSEDLIHSLI